MYSSPQRMTGLSKLYGALEYKQREKLAKEAEEERRRELERQRRQQEAASKHSAFGANLQALGTIGGAIAGSFLPGATAAGAAAGASLGSALASGTMALAPNIGGTQPDASNPYYQPASDLQRGATALQSGLQVWSTYENQIREPWLRKAKNAHMVKSNDYYRGSGNVADSHKYMMPQEGSKFSQAMVDAGYNADNLPWYITEDDVLNLQNEYYVTFNETIMPIGQTGKIDILNDVAMVGETMGNVGLDHIRELTLRESVKERKKYLEEQGIDNPHLQSIAEQPTWLINQGWAKGRELRNATLEEQKKKIAALKKENRDARTAQINKRYDSVMRTWDNIVNNPKDLNVRDAYPNLVGKEEMDAEVFTEIYSKKYGLSSGDRPEMYYDVLRIHAGGNAREYFSTSTNPKVQQAYQLYLAQEKAGTLFSQTGGVAQDQSSATSKKAETAGEVTQQADTTTPSLPSTLRENRFYVNPQEQQAGYAESLASRDDSPETFTPARPNPRTKDAGRQQPLFKAGGMTGTPRARTQTTSPEPEIESGYNVANVEERTRKGTGLNNELYFTEEEEAAESQASRELTGAIDPNDLNRVARPVGRETTGAPSLSQVQDISTPEMSPIGTGMSEALRKQALQKRAPADTVATAQSLARAEQEGYAPQAVEQVGETKEGQKVWVDQYGREFSELTVTIPMQQENADDILYINIPTVVNETGQILKDDEAAAMVDFKDPRDFNTGKRLPVFETEEDAIRGAIQRSEYLGREDYKGSVNPKKATSEEYFESIGDYQKQDDFVTTSDRQGARQRARDAKALGPLPATIGVDQAPTTNYQIGDRLVPEAPKDYTREYPPDERALLEYARKTGMDQDTLRKRLYSIRQGAPEQQAVQGQASTRRMPLSLVQAEKAKNQAGMTGVGRWTKYQEEKARILAEELDKIRNEETVVQPIQKGEAPKVVDDLPDKGTPTEKYWKDRIFYKDEDVGEGNYDIPTNRELYEKVMAAQDRDNATEARMDAEDDRRYDPRQSRASELRKAPPTVPNRLQNEGYPFGPPEEKGLRDAIIEGFPATKRDNLTGIMDQIIALESDGDENAQNPASNASGLLQMVPGTIRQLMGEDADVNDDDTYVAAANKLFTKNSSLLERNGYPVNALNMYVLHHFGVGGKKLLDADSDTLVKDVTYKNVVTEEITPLIDQGKVDANPWINSAAEINQKTWKDLTVGEFLEYLEQAVNLGDFPQPDPQVVAAANNAKVL